MNLFKVMLLVMLVSGCSDNKVETEPAKLVPVLLDAHKCCLTGVCIGPYAGVGQYASCNDATEISRCLKGEEAFCPLKGLGAF